MFLSFWPPQAERKCISGVPSGSNTELTNANPTYGGSSGSVVSESESFSGTVPMALILVPTKLRRFEG